MSAHEWPAKEYAIGSYIQSSIAEHYLKYLAVNPADNVLDIGCGNGAFSLKVLDKVPHGTFLGIDASQNMLRLAKEELASYPNASLEQADVLTMKFIREFDYIVSFWCLQWCALDIETAFLNISRALKANGKILLIFPSGDDSFINSYRKLKESGSFSCLTEFKAPVDYENFYHMPERISALHCFTQLKFEKLSHELLLPSLDIFRKFVNGIAFFHDQIPADQIGILNEALVKIYEEDCMKEHGGQYKFNLSIYLVRGEK